VTSPAAIAVMHARFLAGAGRRAAAEGQRLVDDFFRNLPDVTPSAVEPSSSPWRTHGCSGGAWGAGLRDPRPLFFSAAYPGVPAPDGCRLHDPNHGDDQCDIPPNKAGQRCARIPRENP